MALDLRLDARITQQLVMTPRLQQALKLLQVPTLELEQILRQELQKNPLLEEVDLDEELEEEGITAHKPRKVYVSSWTQHDVYVNIEETIATKIEALRAHKSQMNGWDPEPRIREWAADTAKGKEMAYAEGFRVVTLVSDEDWELCKGDPIKLDAAKREERKKKIEKAEK